MSTEVNTSREIRAEGPGSTADQLRDAYLDLLKLSICDLAGVRTESVVLTIDGRGVVSRESNTRELEFRATGKHWPRNGLTMVGLRRLDDLQRCIESIVADDVPGDLIEAGVWRGGASMLMRATLDTLGARDRTVWLADSFRGFPEDAEQEEPEDRDDLSKFDFLAAPLADVKAGFARLGLDHGVRFVPGFFERTMPTLRNGRWSLARLDGDTYDATRVSLENLYPGLSAGGYVIVDDYELLPECRRAVDEYRAEHGIEEPIEPVDWTCVRWRRESEPAKADPNAFAPVSEPEEAMVVPLRTPGPVPTERERRLETEIAQLRGQLEEAQRGRAR